MLKLTQNKCKSLSEGIFILFTFLLLGLSNQQKDLSIRSGESLLDCYSPNYNIPERAKCRLNINRPGSNSKKLHIQLMIPLQVPVEKRVEASIVFDETEWKEKLLNTPVGQTVSLVSKTTYFEKFEHFGTDHTTEEWEVENVQVRIISDTNYNFDKHYWEDVFMSDNTSVKILIPQSNKTPSFFKNVQEVVLVQGTDTELHSSLESLSTIMLMLLLAGVCLTCCTSQGKSRGGRRQSDEDQVKNTTRIFITCAVGLVIVILVSIRGVKTDYGGTAVILQVITVLFLTNVCCGCLKLGDLKTDSLSLILTGVGIVGLLIAYVFMALEGVFMLQIALNLSLCSDRAYIRNKQATPPYACIIIVANFTIIFWVLHISNYNREVYLVPVSTVYYIVMVGSLIVNILIIGLSINADHMTCKYIMRMMGRRNRGSQAQFNQPSRQRPEANNSNAFAQPVINHPNVAPPPRNTRVVTNPLRQVSGIKANDKVFQAIPMNTQTQAFRPVQMQTRPLKPSDTAYLPAFQDINVVPSKPNKIQLGNMKGARNGVQKSNPTNIKPYQPNIQSGGTGTGTEEVKIGGVKLAQNDIQVDDELKQL